MSNLFLAWDAPDPCLVDTNTLLRRVQPASLQHPIAVRAFDSLLVQGVLLCLARRNLYEYWVAATRSEGENG